MKKLLHINVAWWLHLHRRVKRVLGQQGVEFRALTVVAWLLLHILMSLTFWHKLLVSLILV